MLPFFVVGVALVFCCVFPAFVCCCCFVGNVLYMFAVLVVLERVCALFALVRFLCLPGSL